MMFHKKGSATGIIATIGAVLIFVGIAWMISSNWRYIPSFVKVLILVLATVGAFAAGVIARQKQHEGVGRALLTLGGLLYILSLFLISQIYNLVSSMQHYAWLLFFAWTILVLAAYLLDSPDNLTVAILVFFVWLILQYITSLVSPGMFDSGEGIVIGFVILFLGAGAILYGLSAFHNSINHKFTNIYRHWTLFYFLIIFYLLSFQLFLPMLSQYSFDAAIFTIFLIIFTLICFFGFIVGALWAMKNKSTSLNEILIFLGIIAVLLVMILSTKIGTVEMGTCYIKNCYEFRDRNSCLADNGPLLCKWSGDDAAYSIGAGQKTAGYCQSIECGMFRSENNCTTAPVPLGCRWNNGFCQSTINYLRDYQEQCSAQNNNKKACMQDSNCAWRSNLGSIGFFGGKLPPNLWLIWLINNFIFIGFIILIIIYGQYLGSSKIVHLGIGFFILEIVTRYIGFWLDFRGYFAFSVLAIIGGIILIVGALYVPKIRNKLLEKTTNASPDSSRMDKK